jgi:hypothetical protein
VEIKVCNINSKENGRRVYMLTIDVSEDFVRIMLQEY